MIDDGEYWLYHGNVGDCTNLAYVWDYSAMTKAKRKSCRAYCRDAMTNVYSLWSHSTRWAPSSCNWLTTDLLFQSRVEMEGHHIMPAFKPQPEILQGQQIVLCQILGPSIFRNVCVHDWGMAQDQALWINNAQAIWHHLTMIWNINLYNILYI